MESEVFAQDRFLPPNVKIQVVFHPARDIFRLMTGDQPPKRAKKLNIGMLLLLHCLYVVDVSTTLYTSENMVLHYRCVEVNDMLYFDLMASWRTMPFRYPIRRIRMLNIQKTAGTSDFSEPLVNSGILPMQVYVVSIPGVSSTGNWDREPFESKTDDLTQMSITAEGMHLHTTACVCADYVVLFQDVHILCNH